MSNIKILVRLYNSYTNKYIKNILISVFFTILLAGSTSSVAYLLDPAIKQLFIIQDKKQISYGFTIEHKIKDYEKLDSYLNESGNN